MSDPLEREMPCNLEAERAVLGSLLIDPEAFAEVADILSADDLYREAHRLLYQSMQTLHHAGQVADYLTLADHLERQQRLSQVGGESYLSDLVGAVPTSAHACDYARIVERTSLLRQLIDACSQSVAQAYAQEAGAEAVLEAACQRLFALGSRAARLREAQPLSLVLTAYFALLDERFGKRGHLLGVPSGFGDLDRLTGGWQNGDLIVVAGRPGTGKTALLLSLAYQAAGRFGCRVGIWSLEMGPLQLAERLLARESGLPMTRLRSGLIEDQEWDGVVAACDRLLTLPLLIDGSASLSPMQVRMRARRWATEAGLDLLLIDYVQLMHADASGSGRRENRVQEIDEICRQMKLLARELDRPIVLLAQLSRAVEHRQSKVPMLSDLRESGSIEMNADLVLLLYREELYEPQTPRKGVIDLFLAKHRNGPLGQVTLAFEGATASLREVADPSESGEPQEEEDEEEEEDPSS